MTGGNQPSGEFVLEEAVDLLRRTPTILTAMLRDLPDRWMRANEGPDTFSPFDVVGHLIDGEETDWLPRARIILDRGPDPRFAPYDRFRHRTRNAGRSPESLLDEFGRLRSSNLATLESWHLGPAELALTGIHPTFGPVTLRQLLAAWVVHDLGHVAQVSRVLAKRYGGEVGPWTKFLPVLGDRVAPSS